MVGRHTHRCSEVSRVASRSRRDACDAGKYLEVLGRREQAIADFREALSLYLEGQKAKDALKRLNALP